MKRLAIILITIGIIFSSAVSEDLDEITKLYVTANVLNGRANPSKKALIVARYDRGDILDAFGWSGNNPHWIQVKGGELGVCWVWWDYVSENTTISVWRNDYGKIKLRKEPYGKVVGCLKKGTKDIIISKVLFGWGKLEDRDAWVNLNYLTEDR